MSRMWMALPQMRAKAGDAMSQTAIPVITLHAPQC